MTEAAPLDPEDLKIINLARAARARVVLVRARYETGQVSAALLRGANQAVARLEEMGDDDAPQAHLTAGRVALELGRRASSDTALLPEVAANDP